MARGGMSAEHEDKLQELKSAAVWLFEGGTTLSEIVTLLTETYNAELDPSEWEFASVCAMEDFTHPEIALTGNEDRDPDAE